MPILNRRLLLGSAAALIIASSSTAALAADKILAVDPRRLRPKPNARVDPTGTIRRLRALATLGWSGRAMSDRLGISHASVSRALKGAYEVNSKKIELEILAVAPHTG